MMWPERCEARTAWREVCGERIEHRRELAFPRRPPGPVEDILFPSLGDRFPPSSSPDAAQSTSLRYGGIGTTEALSSYQHPPPYKRSYNQ